MILSQLACRKLALGCPDRRLTRGLRERWGREAIHTARNPIRRHCGIRTISGARCLALPVLVRVVRPWCLTWPGAARISEQKCLTFPGLAGVQSPEIRAGTEFPKHVSAAICAGTGNSKHSAIMGGIRLDNVFPRKPRWVRDRPKPPRLYRTRASRQRPRPASPAHSLTSFAWATGSLDATICGFAAGEALSPRMHQSRRVALPSERAQAMAARLSPPMSAREPSVDRRRDAVSPRFPVASRGWGCCPACRQPPGGGTASGGLRR